MSKAAASAEEGSGRGARSRVGRACKGVLSEVAEGLEGGAGCQMEGIQRGREGPAVVPTGGELGRSAAVRSTPVLCRVPAT